MNNFGYVLIATGEYSDYENSLFKVLKPFNFEKEKQNFENDNYHELTKDKFVNHLIKLGFIEDAENVEEVHIDSSWVAPLIEISKNGNQEFTPAETHDGYIKISPVMFNNLKESFDQFQNARDYTDDKSVAFYKMINCLDWILNGKKEQ